MHYFAVSDIEPRYKKPQWEAAMTGDAVLISIGTTVAEARREARLSRKRLAALADVSERYLHHLENGTANPSVAILLRLAGVLRFDLAGLFAAAPSAFGGGGADAPDPAWVAVTAGMSTAEQRAAAPILQRFLRSQRRARRGIALLGLRGAGKSTLGTMLADRLGLPFVSITREIEARAGMSLNDLFNLGGAEAYRALENEVAGDLSHRTEPIVVETAGGIAGNDEALDTILTAFTTIWLRAKPDEHLARVASQGDLRPMRGNTRALEQLKGLLKQREAGYARADFAIDTSGKAPDTCLQELVTVMAPLYARQMRD